VAGVRAGAVLAHAIKDQTRAFSEHLDFDVSPIDALRLVLFMKDFRKAVEEE